MNSQSNAPLVELTGAGLKRDGKWLVRGVTLSVAPAEIVTLIGPNGSGKSTTAKMALGIHKPDEGKAVQRPKLKVGYVPQKISLDWTLPLSVERLMHLTGKVAQSVIDSAMEDTNVGHLRHSEVRDLSGGEFQRVMMARAVARKPDLLVLDEPVQGVDFKGEAELYNLISTLRSKIGCGVILISHDLHVVMAATDQVVCLNGHVCCQGSPKSVVDSEGYRNLFGAAATSTHALYEHQHDHTHLPDGRVKHLDGSVTDHCHPNDGHHHDAISEKRGIENAG